MAAFPHAELETKQITVLSMPGLERRLSAEVKHASVVTGKDHQRVVGQTVLFETRKNLTNDPVEFMDEVAIKPALAGALKTFRRSEGVMNVGRRQIQKEWLVFPLTNPLDGFLRERCSDLVVVEQFVSFFRSAERIGTALPRVELE